MNRVAVAPGHRLGGEHRVQDRLLDRVDHGLVERVDSAVVQHPEPDLALVGLERAVSGREAEPEIAARVLAHAAGARDSEAGAAGEPFALEREERRVRRDQDDDRAGAFGRPRQRHDVRPDPLADGDAVHAQTRPLAVVRLHEDADHPAVLSDSRRGADSALEAVADHAGAAADGALVDRAVARPLERLLHVLGLDVEAVDVVQEAVPGLAHDREAPVVLAGVGRGDERIANDSHRVRVREADRRRQLARVAHPLEPGQLAVAVDPVRAGEERLGRRDDDGDSGPDVLAFDQRRVSDPDPGHVGDRILGPGREPADLDPRSRARGCTPRA